MKTFLKHMRFASLALALALIAQPVLSTMTPTTAHATYSSYTPVYASAGGGLSSGGSGGVLVGYLVGGVFVSVASLMFCAGMVGSTQGREMTYAEAKLAAWIPLHCLWSALLTQSNE